MLPENPFRDRAEAKRPLLLVIFGGEGDLARRKLIPALYSLHRLNLLPGPLRILGISRRAKSDAEYRQKILDGLPEGGGKTEFVGLFEHLSGDFREAETYSRLAQKASQLAPDRLFYLATPPELFPVIATRLGEAGLGRPSGPGSFSRIVVEKPFGRDLASARELNRVLQGAFPESEIYRIDHYLGKETVQNLLVFRFANGIFEPIWDRRHVDHVQITVAEDIGVGSRGGYYEGAGALRDMIQNHILQLLALTAMEPPGDLAAEAIRDEKLKVLRAVRPLKPEEVGRSTVRGQYVRGYAGVEPVPGYREEKGVDAASETETYVALRLFIDNWRWAGVPFYLRTGKRLARRATEIAIAFREAPHQIFRRVFVEGPAANLLTIRIQPEEGISLRFGAKVPGPRLALGTVNMDFLYGSSFAASSADAYERLLLDAMNGDPSLFTRQDEVEAAWELVTGILEAWEATGEPPLEFYAAGSWGPPGADALLAADNRRWRRP